MVYLAEYSSWTCCHNEVKMCGYRAYSAMHTGSDFSVNGNVAVNMGAAAWKKQDVNVYIRQ